MFPFLTVSSKNLPLRVLFGNLRPVPAISRRKTAANGRFAKKGEMIAKARRRCLAKACQTEHSYRSTAPHSFRRPARKSPRRAGRHIIYSRIAKEPVAASGLSGLFNTLCAYAHILNGSHVTASGPPSPHPIAPQSLAFSFSRSFQISCWALPSSENQYKFLRQDGIGPTRRSFSNMRILGLAARHSGRPAGVIRGLFSGKTGDGH